MVQKELGVLVVDDVNTMRIQIKALLESFGFANVFTAENGEAAKTVLQAQKIHLILADWHMAPTGGLDLLKYVRQNSSYQNSVFMMVTAEATKEKVLEAIQSGVDDYLMKPLTLESIETKVYGVLKRKKVLS